MTSDPVTFDTEAPIQPFPIENFPTDSGSIFPTITVAYQTYGNPSLTPKSKVVLVSTCFGEVLAGEGNPLIGSGKALDPDEYFVIRVGLFGGSDSSSPSNTPAPFHRADFPALTYSDNVRAQVSLLKHLGVDLYPSSSSSSSKPTGPTSLHAVIGFSMGGQLAYHWGVLHHNSGKTVQRIVSLASSAETSLHNVAFLEGPKGALVASGEYGVGTKGPAAFGRAYCAWAMSHDWFQQRKWEDQGFKTLEEFISKAWSNPTSDGYDLLCLTSTWQNAKIRTATVAPGGAAPFKTHEQALKSIGCKALIMPSRTDQYFVPEDSEMEISYLPHGKLAVIETIYGHIGGGGGGTKEDDKFIDDHVRAFLSD